MISYINLFKNIRRGSDKNSTLKAYNKWDDLAARTADLLGSPDVGLMMEPKQLGVNTWQTRKVGVPNSISTKSEWRNFGQSFFA